MADIAILPTSKNQGIQFEQSHVQNVYDEIASRVNDIQHKAWPNVKRFIKKFEAGALIADIGCGNGRYLGINKRVYKIGIDVCKAMVDNSRQKGYEVAYADNLNIPFRDAMFDGVISIGVIHHFCSTERRIQALRELARVLQPGGRLMLYVWAYEQKHRKFDSQDVLVPWHEHRKHRLRAGSTTSSQHSSLGGLSSASSLSEDDSVDQGYQPNENGSQTESPQIFRRRSSASLDDLTSVLERSSFKPSYYSLDFTYSPGSRKRYAAYEDHCRKTAKQNVVSECQKLEASLRAMSLDSFEEIKQLVDKAEFEEKGSLNDVFIESTSTRSEHRTDKSMVECKKVLSAMRHLEPSCAQPSKCIKKTKDAPLKYILVPSEAEQKKGEKKDCKFYIGTECEGKENRSESPVHCSKVNPFLKKNSMDSYTFNNILKDMNTERDLGVFMEANDSESMDEVSVNFKPERRGSQKQTGSFMTSIKSKLLKMFSDESTETIQDNEDKSKCAKNVNASLRTVENSPSGRSELTKEQQEMAQQLNFKVREFPQSSCPKLSIIKDTPTEQCQNKQSCINTQQNLSNVCICQTQYVQNHSKPNTASTHADTDVYPCDCKQQTSNEHEILTHIYDGYIRLDLDISKDKPYTESGALQTDLNAKVNGAINNNIEDCDNGFTHFTFSDPPLCKDFITDLKANSTYTNPCNIYNENDQGEPGLDRPVYKHGEGHESDTRDISHTQCNSNAWPNPSISQDEDVENETDSNFSSKLCRYYHVFREGELEALIANHVKELQTLQCYYDHANWCLVAEKL